MITYELAKKLKDTGFPQVFKNGDYFSNEFPNAYRGIVGIDNSPLKSYGDIVKFPTLSDLIEACGDKFWKLEREIGQNNYIACGIDDKGEFITTSMDITLIPEEAVANLWLELNKK